MVSPTLTSPDMFRNDWPAWWQSLFHLLCVPLLHSLHWVPVKIWNNVQEQFVDLQKPFYLRSMLAPSLPCRSLRSNKDNSLSVPRVKANTGTRTFHSCASSLCSNLQLSVISAVLVATFKNTYHDSCLWLGLSPTNTSMPDGLLMLQKLFLRFYCWTPIWLPGHWVWLCWGYWRYRKVIDWLIDSCHLIKTADVQCAHSWCGSIECREPPYVRDLVQCSTLGWQWSAKSMHCVGRLAIGWQNLPVSHCWHMSADCLCLSIIEVGLTKYDYAALPDKTLQEHW